MDKGICSDCKKLTYIQNKTHNRCSDCVYIRRHGGKSRFDVSKDNQRITYQKNKESQADASKTIKKKAKRIGISQEQKEINEKLHFIYQEIDSEREMICSGCGMNQGGDIVLSHSHIISQKDCKQLQRIDLIYAKENIALHCLDWNAHVGCHRIHETKRASIMIQLNDYGKNIFFIRSISEELYNRIVNK